MCHSTGASGKKSVLVQVKTNKSFNCVMKKHECCQRADESPPGTEGDLDPCLHVSTMFQLFGFTAGLRHVMHTEHGSSLFHGQHSLWLISGSLGL